MSASLAKRWSKYVGKLGDSLTEVLRDCLAAGPAESIHELRVKLRRARTCFRLGKPCLAHKELKRFLAWSRLGVEPLSQVRDLDITLEWLLHRQHPSDLSRQLQAARAERWRQARPAVRELARTCRPLALPHGHGKRLARSIDSAIQSESAAIRMHRRAFERLTLPQLHAFRKHVRRLRYYVELSVPARQQRGHRLLHALVSLQDALGEHLNCVVRQRIFTRLAQPILTQELATALDAEKVKHLRQAELRLKRVKKLLRKAPIKAS